MRALLLTLVLAGCAADPLPEEEVIKRYTAAVCSWVERCRPGGADICAHNMGVQIEHRYDTVFGFPREMTDDDMLDCEDFVDALACDAGGAIAYSDECGLNP